MAVWEWIRSGGVQADIETRFDGMTAGGAFGLVNHLLTKKPLRSASFKTNWISDADSEAIFDQIQDGTLSYTLTDYLGVSWTGTIRSWSTDPVGEGGTTWLTGQLEMIDVVRNP